MKMFLVIMLIAGIFIPAFGQINPLTNTPEAVYVKINDSVSEIAVSTSHRPVILHCFRHGRLVFAGSGSIVRLQTGEERLVTAAHVFDKNKGPTKYVIEEIQPKQKMSYDKGISGIVWRGSDHMGGLFGDVVIASVGKPITIKGFYDMNVPSGIRLDSFEPNYVVFRSLVSGKELLVTGKSSAGHQFAIFIAPFEPRNGESGSGFVDKEGNLYVLSTRISLGSEIRGIFVGPVDIKPESALVALR